MTRLPNWRSRLHAVISEKENAEFKYGKNDCCLFGADIILALTDNDLAADYRGKYRTLSGGTRLIRKDGFKTHIDLIQKSFDEIPVSLSREGDIGLVGPAVVVLLGTFAVGLGENGIVRFQIEEVQKAFSIGE